MRSNIAAGNWKMNKNAQETQALMESLKAQSWPSNARVIVAPPFTNLESAQRTAEGSVIEVAAQNMHYAANGAYTGEVSASMLESIGIKIVILGHSERRAIFHEDSALLTKKVSAALEAGLEVIFCFGEELSERKAGNHFQVVKEQLESGIFHLEASDWSKVILAYEPVWAIGTGETASPEQAQEMHSFIRKTLTDKYGQETAESISVLYGGSVKPANAKEIFDGSDVDGGLVGGASLDAESFASIANSF